MCDVEPDGRRLDLNINIRESVNVHIPAGNPKRETYRLSTYYYFPLDVPIDPRRFARQGFYFTGCRDRVVCFCCGQAAESWTEIDDIRERRWHRDDCDFMNGRDTGNEPIGNLFPDQGATIDFLPSFLPVDQASSIDTTLQSQSVNIDVERSNFETPSSSTQTSQMLSSRNPHENKSILTTSPSSSTTLLLQTFPCSHPINPHMRSKEARLETFLDNSTRWPAHRIRATPQQIVNAGMYYLGLRDQVKCWYCNGGLQNWDQEDDPWTEHAKWFPLCEFVLQIKGPEFVHRIVSLYSGLERPPLYNPTRAEAAREIAQQMHFNVNSVSYQQTHSSVPIIIDPQEEIRKRNENIEMEMKTSTIVPKARKMGFDDEIIKNAFKRHYQGNRQTFASIEPLIEALVNLECEIPKENNKEPYRSTAAHSNNELQTLEESRMCKRCRKQEACIVYIPCGHLVCCADCAKLSQSCRICGEVIREKVRSFLS